MANTKKKSKDKKKSNTGRQSNTAVKKENGKSSSGEKGVVVAGRRSSPAYAPAFIDAVKAQTGDRYVRP